jgi:MoxR-like ATPase
VPPRRKSAPDLTSARFGELFEAMVSNIGQVLKGKEEVVRLSLTAMVAGGHLLFEDYPGTGKTVLARAISTTVSATTSRIQCTPDLLPADITGSPVLDRKTGEFVFRAGPVFANVFLADEINRATPKTQSALLEAMAERTVTVDGTTHPLPKPFFVLATENPIELAGTFPLPEAQLDRFLFKLSMGYMSRDTEFEVMFDNSVNLSIEDLGPVIDTNVVRAMIDYATDIDVSPEVGYYIVDLVHASRKDPSVAMGGSPRATIALLRASRCLAASDGREHVYPDDVRAVLRAVMAHRIVLNPDAMLRGDNVDAVLERMTAAVKPPLSARGRAKQEA